MPLNTISAAVHITPTVIKTFYKHYKHKASKFRTGEKEDESTDDVLYDEAFHIVKSFIELGTYNTVESLQAFTNTRVLSPPWAAVSPVVIPLSTCNKAADILMDWFGPDELKRIVGGERWWQVRGLDGVEAEWVTERRFLRDISSGEMPKNTDDTAENKYTESEQDIVNMNKLDRVMLYIHGGAYFWGSINTHRYQTIKYARKIRGRAFMVNYRKAPQYPWPCALQDVLAAYFYLVKPPPAALHTPVSPAKIVIAGDSAGGGLCLSLLTVLRDLNLEQPAGAVLISPWVDLTHSFPSVMENTATDIIPPHGFIHKPSVVWPVIPHPQGKGRIIPTETPPPPKPGHADTLKPDTERNRHSERDRIPNVSQAEMLEINEKARGSPHVLSHASLTEFGAQSSNNGGPCQSSSSSAIEHRENDSWEPRPPKILMEDPNATPLELRSQIQLYATNEQLTHPLVSPVFQGSLGNLCPLYIIAGNDEALRDEIIYLAHRAAYPQNFPPRVEAVKEAERQMENVEKFKSPTNVHLQVFDGMCHVLTVFTFHPSAKYAYKSIAEFVKYVTGKSGSHCKGVAFPELVDEASEDHGENQAPKNSRESSTNKEVKGSNDGSLKSNLKSLPLPKSQVLGISLGEKSSTDIYEQNKAATKEIIQENPTSTRKIERNPAEKRKLDFTNIVMLRERVDVRGHVRPMEPKDDIPCLKISANDVGLLREAPARRWLSGQQEWDEKFKSTARRVEKQRKRNEVKYQKLISRARELGLVHSPSMGHRTNTMSTLEDDENGKIQRDRRWGPLDLDDENPPPSAIVARNDTPDALVLLRKTLYHTAPRTIRKIPKRRTRDVVRAAFDSTDDPSAPPPQSVSEQQHMADVVPMHGLNIWAALMAYFTKKSSSKAVKGKRKASMGLKRMRVRFRRQPSHAERTDTMSTVSTYETSSSV